MKLNIIIKKHTDKDYFGYIQEFPSVCSIDNDIELLTNKLKSNFKDNLKLYPNVIFDLFKFEITNDSN